MQLVTNNYGGNLHVTASAINANGLADYVLAMDCSTGYNTVVVFRVPDEVASKLRAYFSVRETRLQTFTPRV
jgi:hypothetical protein